MKFKGRKIISSTAMLLAALIVAASAASCASKTPSETTAPATSDVSETTSVSDETEASYKSMLEDTDFGGEQLRICGSNTLAGLTLPTTINFSSGEITGEIVNDTLYARDMYLEDHYNVKIVNTIDETLTDQSIAKLVNAGDDTYDVFITDMAAVGYKLAASGTVYPLNKLGTIHFERGYWEQSAIEALKLGDNLFFATGAISPRYYGSIYLIMFNRDMAEKLSLPNMYDMVSGGSWTIDNMMTLAQSAVSDINGDGLITDDDQLGMAYEVLTPEALMFGCGYHFLSNVGGETKITVNDPGLITLSQKLTSFFKTEGIVWVYGGSKFDETKMVNNGGLLFYNPCAFTLADFRNLDYDYGILPMPKLDEAQSKYIAYGQPWASASPYVPLTVTGDRLTMTGTLIDAMAAYGYDELRPAVFENVLQLKGTRDEESASIIDMVFENVTFDLLPMMKLGKFYDSLTGMFTNQLGAVDLTTLYAQYEESAQNELDSALKAINENTANLKF